ncbi:hypothetical protein BGZ63DRAFT_42013 [Mariannaea sp. PMI_226]|nr:hypothetical protein BGZ63DRAFT_42013 [Mariannaea sp. PMI_226]
MESKKFAINTSMAENKSRSRKTCITYQYSRGQAEKRTFQDWHDGKEIWIIAFATNYSPARKCSSIQELAPSTARTSRTLEAFDNKKNQVSKTARTARNPFLFDNINNQTSGSFDSTNNQTFGSLLGNSTNQQQLSSNSIHEAVLNQQKPMIRDSQASNTPSSNSMLTSMTSPPAAHITSLLA